jgi:rhodanese-related sulfurtransferase
MRQRIPFQCIGVHEAEELVRRNDLLILDVRDPKSFGKTHITRARNVSIANLTAVINGTAKARPILIYCYHGYASREYAQIFCDFGFREVYSLDGGYDAWSSRRPVAGDTTLDEALQRWLAEQAFPQDDVNAVIANGTTPLMKASHKGRSDVVRMLVAAGATLDTRNDDGNNPLWFGCVGGHLDVIDILVESGIDIDNRNDNAATPLMYAASSGKAAIVERFLAKGADTAPETLDGFSALDLASTTECLGLLRRAGGKADAAAARSQPTPLNP